MSQHKYEVIRHFTNEIELFMKNRFLHFLTDDFYKKGRPIGSPNPRKSVKLRPKPLSIPSLVTKPASKRSSDS